MASTRLTKAASGDDEGAAIEAVTKDELGEIESERSFTAYGKQFIFRLPYALDELDLEGRVAQYLGTSPDHASQQGLIMAQALAMLNVYCTHRPENFDFSKKRTWLPLVKMIGEVRQWHDDFRDGVDE